MMNQTIQPVKIPISKLNNHPANNEVLPPLTEEEYIGLKEKMSFELKDYPFEVIEDGKGSYYVEDGNNRLKVLKEIGYEGDISCFVNGSVNDFNLDKQKTRIELFNLQRRNLTKDQKLVIAKNQVSRGVPSDIVARYISMSKKWVNSKTKDELNVRKEIQKEVAKVLVDQGMKNKEVASLLDVSDRQLKNWKKEDLKKINVPQSSTTPKVNYSEFLDDFKNSLIDLDTHPQPEQVKKIKQLIDSNIITEDNVKKKVKEKSELPKPKKESKKNEDSKVSLFKKLGDLVATKQVFILKNETEEIPVTLKMLEEKEDKIFIKMND